MNNTLNNQNSHKVLTPIETQDKRSSSGSRENDQLFRKKAIKRNYSQQNTKSVTQSQLRFNGQTPTSFTQSKPEEIKPLLNENSSNISKKENQTPVNPNFKNRLNNENEQVQDFSSKDTFQDDLKKILHPAPGSQLGLSQTTLNKAKLKQQQFKQLKPIKSLSQQKDKNFMNPLHFPNEDEDHEKDLQEILDLNEIKTQKANSNNTPDNDNSKIKKAISELRLPKLQAQAKQAIRVNSPLKQTNNQQNQGQDHANSNSTSNQDDQQQHQQQKQIQNNNFVKPQTQPQTQTPKENLFHHTKQENTLEQLEKNGHKETELERIKGKFKKNNAYLLNVFDKKNHKSSENLQSNNKINHPSFLDIYSKNLKTQDDKKDVPQSHFVNHNPYKLRSITPGNQKKQTLTKVDKGKIQKPEESKEAELTAIDNPEDPAVHSIANSSKINCYSYMTQAGATFEGPKTNQDNFITYPSVNGKSDRFIFAICDGHGVYGHFVSAFIKNMLPKKIEAALERDVEATDDEFIKNSISLSFLQTSKALLESSIDCTFSGSTTVLLLIIQNKIWSANLGDSRAIMTKSNNSGGFEPLALSNDHKPDEPDEMERILLKGGRCEPYRDLEGNQMGPYRVWLKDDDIPGLAMARSFGDIVASQVGVICEPEIRQYDISNDDRFIVLASDGVWEFLDNQTVTNIVAPFYIKQSPETACKKLIEESTHMWKVNDESRDDITCICIFFKKPSK